MASKYFRSCHSRLYPNLKVTISNDLVSRRKRTFEDFQESERALQPDDKKQRCSSPWLSQKRALPSGIPSLLSNGVAGSWIPSGTSDDSDLDASLLELSDGESPDSPFSISLEDEERLLADDPETDSSNIVLGLTVDEEDSGFDCLERMLQPLQSIPRDPDTSSEPLPPSGLSVHPSSCLPHSSSATNPERGSNVSVGSPNQTELPLSSDRLQGAVPIGTGGFGLNKGDSGFGILVKEANQTGGEELPAVSHLMAEHGSASVATDRPSEGQAFIEQREEGGESTSNLSRETQGGTDFASEIATEHSITAPNEHHVEDSSPEESEDTGLDDPRRRLSRISEGFLQIHGERYVNSVLLQIQRPNHPIGAVNELSALMWEVASESHPQESGYVHPTDLTVRNYARRANTEIQKCNLEQWVNKNQRHFARFAHIPDKFERRPIPSC